VRAGVVDSALYPVLLYSTARELLASLGVGGGSDHANVIGCVLTDDVCAREYGIKLLILLAFTVPNLLSSQLVGRLVSALAIVVMSPFVALTIVGLPQIRVANWLRAPVHPDPASMLSVLYWSLSGFDSASTFAGEVRRPSSTFPRALGLAVVAMVLAYVLPLGVASGADPSWNTWSDGSLAAAARRIGGEWLGIWVMVSSTLSNWGLFASELLEDSFQLLGTPRRRRLWQWCRIPRPLTASTLLPAGCPSGMAEAGLAPRYFGQRHPRFGTPVRAIVVQVIVIGLLAGLDFDVIMCVDNFFSAAAAALEFAAAVELRARRPEVDRPFKIGLGTTGLALFLLLPFGICILVMFVTASQSLVSFVLCTSATLLGVLVYVPFNQTRRATVSSADHDRASGTSVNLVGASPTASLRERPGCDIAQNGHAPMPPT
jgi:amino acid transporter